MQTVIAPQLQTVLLLMHMAVKKRALSVQLAILIKVHNQPAPLQDSVVSGNTATGQGSAFNVGTSERVSFANVTFEDNSGATPLTDPVQHTAV